MLQEGYISETLGITWQVNNRGQRSQAIYIQSIKEIIIWYGTVQYYIYIGCTNCTKV